MMSSKACPSVDRITSPIQQADENAHRTSDNDRGELRPDCGLRRRSDAISLVPLILSHVVPGNWKAYPHPSWKKCSHGLLRSLSERIKEPERVRERWHGEQQAMLYSRTGFCTTSIQTEGVMKNSQCLQSSSKPHRSLRKHRFPIASIYDKNHASYPCRMYEDCTKNHHLDRQTG
jgi:hypothetical protein